MCGDQAAGTATSTTLLENDTVRITEWRFEREGDNTGWHRHGFDYVVVPLFDGQLRIEAPKGDFGTVGLQNGSPYFRRAGVEHDVVNANPFPCRFVEIEIL